MKEKGGYDMVGRGFTFDYLHLMWQVKFVDELSDEAQSRYGATDGLIDYARNTISVAVSNAAGVEYGRDHIRQVLLHELVHLMVMEGQYKDEYQSEAFIEWMARALDELIGTEAFKRIMELK